MSARPLVLERKLLLVQNSMGKKRIIEKSEEELIKESAKVEAGVKDVKIKAVSKTRDGRIYISSSYNNTIITLTDSVGNKLTAASAGSIGFKGAKKATPFAASKVAEGISLTAKKLRVNSVEIYVKGIGSGRDSAIRSLAAHGLDIKLIKDVTPVPHNGCRPPKVRRV